MTLPYIFIYRSVYYLNIEYLKQPSNFMPFLVKFKTQNWSFSFRTLNFKVTENVSRSDFVLIWNIYYNPVKFGQHHSQLRQFTIWPK